MYVCSGAMHLCECIVCVHVFDICLVFCELLAVCTYAIIRSTSCHNLFLELSVKYTAALSRVSLMMYDHCALH